MVPALRDGDVVLTWLATGTPKRGRVVLVVLPDRPLSVKRLVAVNGDGSVVVEGDNPVASTDSRDLGPLPAGSIRGVVLCRLWPKPGRLSALQHL